MDINQINHTFNIQLPIVSRTQNTPMGQVGVYQQPMGQVGVYHQNEILSCFLMEEKVETTIDMFPQKRRGYTKFTQLACNECGMAEGCACFAD